MVQGLAFLSKKSFHTANLNNQEKVWIAEQKKAAEESKTKELARQIQLEREREELDKITNGKNSVRKDRGINWMYEEGGGAAVREEQEAKKAEDFLLGKSYAPEDNSQNEKKATEGVDAIISNVSSKAQTQNGKEELMLKSDRGFSAISMLEESAYDRNEEFRLRHEDPMWAVLQQQQEKKTEMNKKKALFEKVIGSGGYKEVSDVRPTYDGSKDRSDRHHKSRKKERKKHSRRHDDRHRHRHRSDDKYHSRRRRRSRSRSRSPSEENRYRSHHRSHGKDRRHRHRSPSNEHCHSDMKDRDRRKHSHRDRRKRRSRSKDRSPDSWEQSSRREYQKDQKHEDYNENACDRDTTHHDSHHKNKVQYGLQGGSRPKNEHTSFGPDQDLLKKKREEREAVKQSHRNNVSRRTMTAAEKEEAVRQMQSYASQRDQALQDSIVAKKGYDYEDCTASDRNSNQKATFLHEMATRAHGIGEGNDVSMAERVARNRHSNQRLLNDSFK